MIFQGREEALEQAILQDNALAVAKLIEGGADPNARGRNEVTPVEFAVGNLKKHATTELLRHGADLNLKDVEGDNAVTLAVRAYNKEPDLLAIVLKSGGDPNTRQPDGDPVIAHFIHDHNLEAIRFMKAAGADIDARSRSGDPLIIEVGITEDWDVLWTLLDLGAKYDYPDEPMNLVKAFATPEVTPPDSPLWPYKVKVWKFLHERGLPLPPLQ